jgi:methionyl-tRNA formyltransferase
MGSVSNESKKLTLVFMGTPEFAVPSLEALIDAGYQILSVITQPDRPKGRGRNTAPSEVKVAAQKHSLKVLEPEKVRDEGFLREFLKIEADMAILVAFGQILPKAMLEAYKYGIVNVHPSLLPKYRGAAPINWALINGECETGVTTMRIGEGVDSGDILMQEKTPIRPDEDFGSLETRLARVGARLLLETIDGLANGCITPVSQDHVAATYAPKINKEDTHMSWDAPPQHVVNLIRGLSPAPAAYSILNGKQLKIFSAGSEPGAPASVPGTVLDLTEKGLRVAARDGFVMLRDIQMEGKKRMGVKDFLRGHQISGEVLA